MKNLLSAPENCLWSSWSEWTPCSKTCGKGQRTKTRTVLRTAKNGGKDCTGNSRRTQQCRMKKCPDVDTLSTFSDCCDSLEVYYNGPLEYTLNSIYGYYVRQEDLIHGRPWYKNDGESIWWDDKYSDWSIGDTISKGSSTYAAYLENDGRCLPKILNQKWNWGDGTNWHEAGNKINVRCGYKPKGII